jgi:hypothetical protein
MTALKCLCSASRSKHVAFSLFPTLLLRLVLRHIGPYMRGIISFAWMSPLLLVDEARYQAGKLQEIGHPEHRVALAEDYLWSGRHDVGPLPRHQANVILVDAQHESSPVPVVPFTQADELPPGERVERVGHAHKARSCERRDCSSG